MPTFNVAAQVVDLIDAPDIETAKRKFVRQLKDFQIVDGTLDAFVSEVEVVTVDVDA